jgi:hypothetical protein
MRWRAIRRLWPVLLPPLLLTPGLLAFPYPSAEAAYSDLALAHYPYTLFIRSAIAAYHSLPLWSPLIYSGAPLAGNPLAGMWYPPGWLALLLPLPLAFNLLVCLHLVLGGVGAYLLARAEGLSHPAALFSGLAFELLPKLFAHYGAGHLTLLYAVPWTPWLLLAFRRDAAASRRLLSRWSAAALALTFLADVRWAAYAGLLWLVYALARWPGLSRAVLPAPGEASGRHLPAREGQRMGVQVVSYVSVQLAQATLFAMPLAFPLLVFVWQSSRRWMSAADFLAYSLPPARLLGLVFPDFAGFHEFTLYPGALVLSLGLLALVWGLAFRRARFWGLAALVSLVFSLGESIPGLGWLSNLPLVGLLRVPSRALFLFGLALALLAGFALEHLLDGPSPGEQRRGGLLLTALAGFALVLAGGVWAATGAASGEFFWGGFALLVSAVWLVLGFSVSLGKLKRLAAPIWLVGLFAVCLLDLGAVDASLYSPRPLQQVLAEGAGLAQALSQQPGPFRVYSPSVSLPQYTAAYYHLELADGVDPMQFSDYVTFMQAASGVPQSGYSVTLPPFSGGDPKTDNASYRPDPQKLGLLNVRFVAAEFDLPVDGLRQVGRFGDTRVYENQSWLPRAWVQPQEAAPGEQVRPVQALEWQPNRIRVTAVGPGLLVLAEVDVSGWRVRVDGSPQPIRRVAGILRGVELPPGDHQVVFTYLAPEVWEGLAACALGFVWLLVSLALSRASRRAEGKSNG